jgi:hypothetical protein
MTTPMNVTAERTQWATRISRRGKTRRGRELPEGGRL